MSMSDRYRMVTCSLCNRKWPKSRCTPGELNRRKAIFCEHCAKPMQAGVTDAASVRQQSEQRGRKR